MCSNSGHLNESLGAQYIIDLRRAGANIDVSMAELSSDTSSPPVDVAADDEPSAHACGDLHIGKVRHFSTLTPPVLGERAEVCIILNA